MKQEDHERMKNLLLFKCYVTDEEFMKCGPLFVILGSVVLAVIVVIINFCIF